LALHQCSQTGFISQTRTSQIKKSFKTNNQLVTHLFIQPKDRDQFSFSYDSINLPVVAIFQQAIIITIYECRHFCLLK